MNWKKPAVNCFFALQILLLTIGLQGYGQYEEAILVEAGMTDASLKLASGLLSGSDPYAEFLENTMVIIVPVFNVGGALNRGKYNRANQKRACVERKIGLPEICASMGSGYQPI